MLTAVAISSAIGVAFAANLFTLFIFYEVLTLSTYPLVTHYGDDGARKAGRTYLGILLSTSVAFLLLATALTFWSGYFYFAEYFRGLSAGADDERVEGGE